MKKTLILSLALLIVVSILWTGLHNIYKKSEGYHFINPTFAMMNKSLFLQKDEYNNMSKLKQTIILVRENGIRELYLELTVDCDLDKVMKAIKELDTYGITVGLWYDQQRNTVYTHNKIIDQLTKVNIYRSNITQDTVSLYFVQMLQPEELVTYKDTYLSNILQLTNLVKQGAKEQKIEVEIGWVLPQASDGEKLDIIYNGYTKRFHFHVLDSVDEIAIISTKDHTFLTQVLNESIYAKRKDKQVNIAIESLTNKVYKDNNVDLLETIQREYQDFSLIDSRNQLLFLEQDTINKLIKLRYDINDDSEVNIQDFIVFVFDFIKGNTKQQHDFNYNNVVDIYDLIAIFLNFSN
jgi:hypothetical protein